MPYLTLPLREAANMPDTNMATINSNPESFQRPDLQKAPYLTFKVVNSKQPGAPFKMRSSTSLGKVMDAYCERLGIERANTHFLYDDVRVNKRDTPASIGMVEGDVIEALSEHLQKVQAAAQIEQLSGKMEQLQVVLADDKKEMINILVKDWNDHIVYFKMKPSTSLGKLMNAFCEREGLDRSNVRFLWEGSRISDADTPDELDIKDLNTIDVYPEQVGGGSPDPEEKPKEEPAKKHISIKVKDDQGNEVYFKIKYGQTIPKCLSPLRTFNFIVWIIMRYLVLTNY
jgi:small ubiquitin-related modifier